MTLISLHASHYIRRTQAFLRLYPELMSRNHYEKVRIANAAFSWVYKFQQVPTISSIAHHQEGWHLCLETQVNRRSKNESIHLSSLFIEYSCFKSYIATAKWHCAIAKWVGLSLPSSSSLLTSCENSSNNLVSLWLTYPGNKYNVSRFVSG